MLDTTDLAGRLRTDLAGIPLLAMGQTVFWDEPTKAALRLVLDKVSPETAMLVGVHDTDYFSRLGQPWNSGGFVLTGHDDGPTRDLWVAAAEASQLFGSETVVTRALLSEHGVPIDRMAREESREAFLSEATAAWGWRGVALESEQASICAGVGVTEVLPKLVELLRWATSESAITLGNAESAKAFAHEFVAEVQRVASELPADAKLPELYRRLAESYWKRLLGGQSKGLRFCTSSQLFRFNTQTASLPRFRFLDLFLNPTTSDAARRAYNEAVRDSDIYSLDRFSEVALPFDLVLLRKDKPPCRGTICVADNEVVILAPCSTVLHTGEPPASVGELASLIEQYLGSEAIVIGKALTLVPMILSEWVFVLHRFGSAYIPRSRAMVEALRAAGIKVPLHPILRIAHDAWSSLANVKATFQLPPHLAQAFERPKVTAHEYAHDWREAVERQEQLLEALKQVSNPEELMEFLTHEEHEAWLDRMQAYVDAHMTLVRVGREIERLRHVGIDAFNRAKAAKEEIQRLEKEKGNLRRHLLKPLKARLEEAAAGEQNLQLMGGQLAEAERQDAELQSSLTALRRVAIEEEAKSVEVQAAYRALEKCPEVVEARATVSAVEHEARLCRLGLVRNALLTTHGLPYSGARPTWWWFPMVDPSGRWFQRLAETARYCFEEL